MAGPFSFKGFLSFAPPFTNSVRLGNRTYRAWGSKIDQKNGKLNSPVVMVLSLDIKTELMDNLSSNSKGISG